MTLSRFDSFSVCPSTSAFCSRGDMGPGCPSCGPASRIGRSGGGGRAGTGRRTGRAGGRASRRGRGQAGGRGGAGGWWRGGGGGGGGGGTGRRTGRARGRTSRRARGQAGPRASEWPGDFCTPQARCDVERRTGLPECSFPSGPWLRSRHPLTYRSAPRLVLGGESVVSWSMRAIWSGEITFGLVNVPVKLYGATRSHDISFHQVHDEDHGRIRYQRHCEVCGRHIDFEHIEKAYDDGDKTVILSDEEL